MKQNIEPKERVKILESYDYDSSDKGGTLISNNDNNETNESEDAKIIEEKNKPKQVKSSQNLKKIKRGISENKNFNI